MDIPFRFRKINKWLLKYLFWPIAEVLLVGGPTALLASSIYIPKFKGWYDLHPYITAISALWFIPGSVASQVIKKRIASKPKDLGEGINDAVLSLFEAIDNVVGVKSNRFAEATKKFQQNARGGNGSVIFQEITQPDLQIQELVHAVYYFWGMLNHDRDINFRVALARMGRKYIEEFVCFDPQDKPIRGEIRDYQVDECGFSRAKKYKKIIIIPNIAKNLKKNAKHKKYYVVVEGSDKNGSMIVYPIHHHGLNDIVYCLSVYCNRANYFVDDNHESYKNIFEKFSKRIILEHSLKMLKEQSNG